MRTFVYLKEKGIKGGRRRKYFLRKREKSFASEARRKKTGIKTDNVFRKRRKKIGIRAEDGDRKREKRIRIRTDFDNIYRVLF